MTREREARIGEEAGGKKRGLDPFRSVLWLMAK